MQESSQQPLEQRITELTEHLSTIRRNMEQLIADNTRMREVVRIAEGELCKRRDQAQKYESELEELRNNRLEAKARVEHVMEKVDDLIASGQQGEAS